MFCTFGKLARVIILAALTAGACAPVQPSAATHDSSALTRVPFEVRLRKLHLVRPDLIPYPIMLEVYC